MAIYINGAQAISPQNTFLNPQIPGKLIQYDGMMQNIMPDFKDYFNPIEMRRMSRIIKCSSATAAECIKEANADKIDAILTNTGLGCMEDTEKFLNTMLDTNEGLLTPTTFIQSTHNTLGGKIAIDYKCNEYNLTYAHKSISFQSGLLDAMLLIKEGRKNILVGGVDEVTPENYNLRKHINQWKDEPYNNLEIYNSNTPGTIAGEGTTFFMISAEKSVNAYAEIKMIDMFHKSKGASAMEENLKAKLKAAGLLIEDIDLVIFGYNGDSNNDVYYNQVKDTLFAHSDHAYFKHFCGEYDTSPAFGMWMAARVIKQKNTPDNIIIGNKKKANHKNVLLYNQENNTNHSFILLSAC